MFKNTMISLTFILFTGNAYANEKTMEILGIKLGQPISVSEAEIKDCARENEIKIKFCETIIRHHKKAYLLHITKGYPLGDAEELKERLKTCDKMEGKYQYSCKNTTIQAMMDVEKTNYLKEYYRRKD